jgi:hypothetical protein
LKTAQTGALVEARLELNIYHLLKKKNIPFPQWMGEKIELQEMTVFPSEIDEILATKKKKFLPTESNASYLLKCRAKFAENEIEASSTILEYVVPQKVSTNTLITLPVIRHNGEVFVGLEIRDLPVPQLLSGNSNIMVAPACRLPIATSNFKQLEDYLLEMDFYGTRITGFNKLGEKFFPSIGVTPEQVYPYIVAPEFATDQLKWVKLNDLWNCLESIRDGHLLIALFRLGNALL